jgi:adenine phosphoribosyltransferase
MTESTAGLDPGKALDPDVLALIRDIPDFPSSGIVFRDIAPMLADAAAFAKVSDWYAAQVLATGATLVAGVESRGFVLGAPAALRAGVGFVPVRKAGKLPGRVHRLSYALEYGTAELEIQADAVPQGARVLVVDDVLATGGTATASAGLVRAAGGDPVALAVLLELGALGGREHLTPWQVRAAIVI